METKFNFKSAVCTSRSQSERLLALGLKPETADMSSDGWNDPVVSWGMEWSKEIIESGRLPAWSLHRLIEMTLCDIFICGISFVYNDEVYEKVIRIIENQIHNELFPKQYLNF